MKYLKIARMALMATCMISGVMIISIMTSGCNTGGGSTQGGGSSGGSATAWSCPTNHHDVPTVIAFGDSLAAQPNSWAIQFAGMLNMPLQNFAVGGTWMFSPNQYQTIMCVEINSDDIVVYQPGTNDAWKYRENPTYVAQYKQGLTDILNKIEATHAIALMGTTHHEINRPNGVTNIDTDFYAQIMRDALSNTHYDRIYLVDTNSTFTPDMATNMADEVHPNTLGYNQMAQGYLSVYNAVK